MLRNSTGKETSMQFMRGGRSLGRPVASTSALIELKAATGALGVWTGASSHQPASLGSTEAAEQALLGPKGD